MVDAVSAADNWSAISAVVGAGGVSGIIIAVVGYLTAARSGRRGEPDKAAGFAGISALMADSGSITSLALSIDRVALAADKIAVITIEERQEMREFVGRMFKLANDLIDEVRELRRAVEDRD